MKKILLQRMRQKDQDFYFFVEDPRKIIKLVNYPNKNEAQENQRPWNEKRVKDLAKYISGDDKLTKAEGEQRRLLGLIPTCPILNVKGNIKIETENNQSYLLFPDMPEEFEQCKGGIEILDGQHRLIACDDQYKTENFKDSEVYQCGFIVFENLINAMKKELFIVTNERAEKVNKTVLNNMQRALGVLSQEDMELFNLISLLNDEDMSPLQSRINMDGSKTPGLLSALEFKKVLEKESKFLETIGPNSNEMILKIVSVYLDAWQKAYGLDFRRTKKQNNLEKIGGIRYIFTIYQAVHNILDKNNQKFTVENIVSIIKKLEEYGIADLKNLSLSDRSSIIKAAQAHGNELKNRCINTNKDMFANL